MNIRKWLLWGFTGAMLIGMTGCTGQAAQTKEQMSVSDENTAEVTTDYRMPETYEVSYERYMEDGTICQIALLKDLDGNFYFQNGEQEKWFKKQGNGYQEMSENENGELEEQSTGRFLTEDSLEEITEPFWECVETTRKQISPGFERKENTTILERDCLVYENTQGIAGLNVTYHLAADQETNICMEWSKKSETGIFDSKDEVDSLYCTAFETEEVRIPEFD